MTRYAKTMSQALAEVQVRELKMNDPKLIKVFDKLKPKDTIKLKVSSGISKGKDFQPYNVRAKNTLRNGVEKITMILQGNPTGVKRFLYKKDGKVTFAIGDMAASIDDIKEEVIHELVIEEVELDEGRMKDLLIKGQDLEAYAKKHGGIDKKDMMKVAAMLKKGDKSGALKYAKGMDTDPRDYILDLMGEELDEKTKIEFKPNPDDSNKTMIMKKGKEMGNIIKTNKGFQVMQFGKPAGKVFKSLDDIKPAIKKLYGEEVELNENKLTYVEYKFKNKNEAMKAKKMLLKSFNEVDDEDINRGTIIVDAGDRDMTKQHDEIMKTFRPKVIETRKQGLRREEVELDEGMKYTHVAVDKKGLVIGFASDEKDAKDMARRNDGKVVKLKKPMSDKKGDMMVTRPFKEDLGKEDEPKVKEIIKKLKGASQAHAGQAKDLEKAISENSKGKEMSNEKLTDGNLS